MYIREKIPHLPYVEFHNLFFGCEKLRFALEDLASLNSLVDHKTNMKRSGKLSKVGPYIIMETLGVGAFAKVKLCVHHHTLDRYACKIIDKSSIRERMTNLQVQREIAILSRLRHRNTVSLVSVHSTATRVFIVMELVTGGELFDEIFRVKRLNEPQARYYFRQLIEGMRYCHSRGVYHRDLKPDNLLVDLNHTLKITDFGLAALKVGGQTDTFDSLTSSLNLHTQCGTPNYVAPEVINIEPNGYSGSKADAWACGIILYILVGGALPFDAGTLAELFRSIVSCDLLYPPSFSEGLIDLIDKMLNADPDKRYSLADVQKHPWYKEPAERPTMPPRSRLKILPTKSGSQLEVSPVYPSPEEQEKGTNAKSPEHGSTPLERARRGQGSDSKDSLDFGTRVESVASGLTISALPSRFKHRKVQVHDSDTGRTIASDYKRQGEHTPNPTSGERNMGNGENNQDGSNKDETCDDSEAGSDAGSDECWILSDADRLVWCRMMKDFDMVPDAFEFGMDSATLSVKWQNGLAKEKLYKTNSFAAGRFGPKRDVKSRSTECGSADAAHLDAVKHPNSRSSENPLKDVTILSNNLQSTLASPKEIMPPDQDQHLTAEDGDELNHRKSGIREETASEHSSSREEDQRSQDIPIQALAPSESPKFVQPSTEAEIPGGPSSSDTDVKSENSNPLASSAYMMGEGQDLLEENKVRESVTEYSTDPGNCQEADIPLPSFPESEENALEENQELETTTSSPLPDTESPPAENSAPVIPEPGNDWRTLSPFAIDVPGPRRVLPTSKNIFSSIVPGTVSPRRLFRRKTSSHDIKSFTQFHSLLDPESCVDVIQSVLQDYGCTVIKTSASRSRQKFQIKCFSRKGDVMIHTRLSIYRLDDLLSTIIFKRLPHTDIKDFMRFYSDITRSYSEAMKTRGLSDGAKEVLAIEY